MRFMPETQIIKWMWKQNQNLDVSMATCGYFQNYENRMFIYIHEHNAQQHHK